jgi:hypothetical protein
MSQEKHPIKVPENDSESIYAIASFVTSVVPWIGGPISNVLSGISVGRKISRLKEIMEGIVSDLEDFKSESSENYVKTDEFEELTEKVIKKAIDERNDKKRKLFRLFLTNSIKTPGETYDEKIILLRLLDDIQFDHVRLMQSLLQEPNPDPSIGIGYIIETLKRRLPDLSESHITDLCMILNDLRLCKLESLGVMLTPRGAEDLKHCITPLGNRLLEFIKE